MTVKLVLVLSLAASAAVFSFALAASIFDIEYPIPELGNCADRLECKGYCNNPENAEACFEFAKKYGLTDSRTEEKINQVKKLAEDPGPGGCNSRESCEEYCRNPDHSEECVDDSVKRGFMSKEEGQRAKKLARGGPGGCRGDECRTYCNDPAHEDECFEFAAENGFIEKQEVERNRDLKKKFGNQQGGPGGCKNERECRTYCDNPDYTEECIDFAEKNGLMNPEEIKRIKKIGLAGGPGGCKGPEACRVYCDDPEHQQECIDFAEREGLMSKDEVARARKFAGKAGPGGCKGERECRAFCESPDNAEVCLTHAEQEGLMPKEEIERARKFLSASKDGGPGGCKGVQCRDYCEEPEHRDECFDFAKKQGLVRPEEERQFDIGKKLDQKMKESGGPGGCKTENECRAYCSDPSKVEECVAFASTHAGVSQEDAVALLRQFTEHRFGPPPPPGSPPRGPMPMGPPGGFQRFEEESLRRFEEFRQLEEQFRGSNGEMPGFPGFGPPIGKGEFSGKPPFEEEGDHSGEPTNRPFMVTGPGGCTSPDECIKYCIEHKEDCFNFGPPDRPQMRPPEGGVPPGRDFRMPRLREDLFNEFRQDNQGFVGSGSGGASVRIMKDPLGTVKLFIRDSDGIKSFSLEPTDGSRYGGDMSGCAREYSSEPSFNESSFPIKASIIDCADNAFEITVQKFDSGSAQQKQQPMDLRGEGAPYQPSPGQTPFDTFRGEFQRQYQDQFQHQMDQQMRQMPFVPIPRELEGQHYLPDADQFGGSRPPLEMPPPQHPMTPLDSERERIMAPLIPEGWVFPVQPVQPQFPSQPSEFQPPPEESPEQPALAPPTSFRSPLLQLAGVLFSTFSGR